ncbi:hypothetical protein [Spirilliplanes yamanashiensis]|uniref:Uncharacterized protein n=1 Tax=Spirilliplanes yamanashiensis TaxID=42233 RepID=A0A8J3YCN3_9ACTN|nr:hypothetical protein [Spirilliplanes yamanashiensis]MDP9819086.1 hypothetical protein [Spirilliplanes yamanashiensis]GIJ05540.1 hypothetical protein Sya03_48920 [Spirilliplanes yamanashiensis]
MTDFQSYDTDGDGFGDTLAADTNANGVLDTYAADGNGDGYSEMLMVDSNENGLLDTYQVDTDLNGAVDTSFVDGNENGVLDQVNGRLTGNRLVQLLDVPSQPAPLTGDPAVIGGGGHDPLISLLEHATPQQAEIIIEMMESRQDAIENILSDDDDDDY